MAASPQPDPNPKIIYIEIFINNEFRKSISGKTFKTINPVTEEVIADVQYGGKEDVNLAVDAAKKAFDFKAPWRTISASTRGKLINKLADLMERDREYLANLESLDNGKPFLNAYHIDLPKAINYIRYYAGWPDKISGKVIPIEGQYLSYTLHEPVGVCGQIIPWNYPLLMIAMKIAPALAAGNTIVIKPAEQTPLTALYVAQLIKEAGFPPGVVNVVPGDGVTGAAIVDHPGVDKIAFTGSTEVGLKIQQSAASKNRLKRVTLELGGKSPLIIFGDVDIDKAVMYAQEGAYMNQGQTCCALTRTYVHSSIYDEFVKKSAERAKTIVVGDPYDLKTKHGPQIDETQMNKILHYINLGVKEGAILVTGGKRFGNKGYFVEPTVFADVKDEYAIARDEIFGPVQSILKFDDIDEVIERANRSYYGLAASVLSNNLDTVNYIVPRLKAGTVTVNSILATGAQAPFGGYKNSGIGREGGEYGLQQYLEIKLVSIDNPNRIS